MADLASSHLAYTFGEVTTGAETVTDVTITGNENLQGIQYVNGITTGATVSINPGISVVLLNPTASLASLIIAMPSSPVNGETVHIASSNVVTAFTFTNGTVLVPSPHPYTNCDTFNFLYHQASSMWWPV